MADPQGFMRYPREEAKHRPVPLRLMDYREVYEQTSEKHDKEQAARCMDCGIPFCHEGCPLGNIIPEWNDLVRQGRWQEAYDRLHATNNFPDFTGRLCPAPCEGACVLGINDDPVSIKHIEQKIVDVAFENDWVEPIQASFDTGRSVAVVGSGPAGLAAAQQLTRAGHRVTVYERDDRLGGLMRYGVPEYKMEKKHIDRRIEQMRAEGTEFKVSTSPSAADLAGFNAIVLATGTPVARDLPVDGRDDGLVDEDPEPAPARNRRGRPEPEQVELTRLNPKYTFDTFVIGASNRFANAAAVAVADAMMAVPNRSLRLLTGDELRLFGLDGVNPAQDDLDRLRLMRKCGEDFVTRRDSFTRAFDLQCKSPITDLDALNACGLDLRQRFGFPDETCPAESPLSEFDVGTGLVLAPPTRSDTVGQGSEG